MVNSLLASISLLLASNESIGNIIYSQMPANPPGGTLPSQIWVDPTAQNDSTTDSIAYDDFTLASDATITHLEWWGDAAPSLGFTIMFYNQDPSTTAIQPDLPQFHGGQALSTQTATNFTQTAVGNAQYHFNFDLTAPVSLSANTSANPRYFVAIHGNTPNALDSWNWAQGYGGDGTMFYYQYHASLAGGPYYSYRADRTFLLGDATIPEPSAVWLLLTGLGALGLLIAQRKRTATD